MPPGKPICLMELLKFPFSALKIFSCSMWNLVSWPGIEPRPPALGVLSLSHWTTREVPPLQIESIHKVGFGFAAFNIYSLLTTFHLRFPARCVKATSASLLSPWPASFLAWFNSKAFLAHLRMDSFKRSAISPLKITLSRSESWRCR